MCDNSLKVKFHLKEISAVYLHCISGGGKKDNDASFAQSTPPTTNNSGAFNFPPPPSPISGYIGGNENGAKLDVNYDLNKNFAIAGSATTDYNKIVNKSVMFIATYEF
jgi:hypothetical protein